MAKNDMILIDGIVEDRISKKIPSTDEGEVFEYLTVEQLLKDYDLSEDELLSGSIDGENDGGIDFIYYFINGHLIDNLDDCYFPKSDASLTVYIITCKHYKSFKQNTVEKIMPTLTEFFDLSMENKDLNGEYNEELLQKRTCFIKLYKRIASILDNFTINVVYSCRGDTQNIETNLIARAEQIKQEITTVFSGCKCNFDFLGSEQIIALYRKRRTSTLNIPYDKLLSNGKNKIILTKLHDYYSFIINEDFKLRRYLFDSNVRAYMGFNHVNSDIMFTLQNEGSPDFWLLNNGITILATKAEDIGNEIIVENIQIVNGLQTSETIYNYFSNGGKDENNRNILVKIIVTDDSETRDLIIKATNNQTTVEQYSLRATDKIQRDIEEILYSHNFYYERRLNYYAEQGIDSNQILTPLYLASGFICLIEKNICGAIKLKQRFMRNEERYNSIYNSESINIWPAIAKIEKESERIIMQRRNSANLSCSEGFLKLMRQILSFITTAKFYNNFNFLASDIEKLTAEEITYFEFGKVYDEIIKLHPNFNKQEWKTNGFVFGLLKEFENLFGIQNAKHVINKVHKYPDNVEPDININESYIELIKNQLPKQPWPQNIHKNVAKKLNISPKIVHKVISILIQRGDFKKQKNNKVL